ncbi:MAG TPA: FKBP-type peptidyl-prolyl cis-trans isomerase [Candidatus Bathyarchaeia archaeon]|jgi:FKBP-type peptidyl-prolyl cis-trans isomerase|nr:FKBP-type peptidyl-prolyl cis-trans isomerase [Candidatus Bathyarchaeia archaeon]
MTGSNTSRFSSVAALLVLLMPGVVRASQGAAPPQAPAVADIQLSYKRDPRVVDGFRGIGPWARGPSFGGATAQDSVETVARAVDAKGKPTKANMEWIASDPEMVTVTPSKGDHVTIKVLRAGESKLKVTAQGFSKELEISAKYVNKFMLFEIAEAKAAKPNAPPATAKAAPPARSSKSDISYAIGMNLAKALQEQSLEADVDSLMQGVKDTLSGGKTRLTEEQALATLEGVETDQRIVEASLNRKAVGERNKREGEAFLAKNKTKEGVVSLPSGLQYKVIKEGTGKKPAANDVVTVQYRGSFIDGKVFDDSSKRQGGSVSFPVNSVIRGWQEALQLMPVGSKWQLFMPSDLAYGERGAGGGHGGKRSGGPQPQIIGPNTALVFDVELLSIGEAAAKRPASISSADQSIPPELLEILKKAIEKEATPDSKPEKKEINQ